MPYKALAGQRLKHSRKAAGLTLKELSNRLPGMIPSRLSNYEQGRRSMDIETAVAIARALNIDPAWLLGFEKQSLTQQEAELINLFRRTDNRGRNQILQTAKAQPIAESKTIAVI